MSGQLVLHRGGELVTEERLAECHTPEPSGRWHPTSHTQVLATVKESLSAAGYVVLKQSLAILRDGSRFFGTLDLATELDQGVCLAVGIRNSVDKTFPLGFCAGNRVFVCDNLAFSAELMVKKKHTRYGEMHFGNGIAQAVQNLASFKDAEVNRIAALKGLYLSENDALAFMVKAMERRIITAQTLPKVLEEWRTPTFDYGCGTDPTAWRLFNSFTTVLGDRAKRNPNEYTGQTIRLNNLMLPAQPALAV